MLSCNVYENQTVGTTQQLASCISDTAGLEGSELPEEQFLLVVLDQLQRRASGIGTGELPLIQDLLACDIEQAARNAYCAALNISPPFDINATKLKALILTMLNEFNCT